MKKIKFIIPFFLLLSSLLLSCYTQLRAPNTETINNPTGYNDEEYYVRDSIEVDKEIIVHHYYHFADPYYYDPWYYDPWYWGSASRWGIYVGFSSFWWYPWDWYRPCCYPIVTPYAWYYPHYYGWYPYYPPYYYYTYKDYHKRPWDRRGFEPTRQVARGGSGAEKQIATGSRRSTSENSAPIFVSGSRSENSSTRIVQRNTGSQQGVSTSSSEKQNVSSPRTINRQEPASSRQPSREAVRPSRSSQRSPSGSYSPKSRSGSSTTSSSGSHQSSGSSGSSSSGSSIRSTDRGSSSSSSSSHGGQSSSSSSGRSSSSGNSSSGSSSRSTNRK